MEGPTVKYDFNLVIDRRGTYSIKHDPAAYGMPDDILPMWVADMDFQAPPCVAAALEERVRHGVYGYSRPDEGYFDAAAGWLERRFGWRVRREWLVITQGVVNAIHIAIKALGEPGDGVVIQQPVYYPFEQAVRNTGRRLLVNELVYSNGLYSIDFDDFEDKIKQAKLFILCSPHNPVGRVWTRDELERMGGICLRYGVTVISDEIHQDFVYPGRRHIVFAGLDPGLEGLTVTCTAPSKTFNLAGLPLSNIFIQNKELRDRFIREYANCGLGQPGVMSIAACKAAYEAGEEWLDELLLYLGGNVSMIREFLQARVPKIRLVEPEGTYLAWLDCTGLGFSAKELDDLVVQKAKLWLDGGDMFGASGAGFQRLNTASPRSILHNALTRLESAFGL
jgi:cystathionine beta-lyase